MRKPGRSGTNLCNYRQSRTRSRRLRKSWTNSKPRGQPRNNFEPTFPEGCHYFRHDRMKTVAVRAEDVDFEAAAREHRPFLLQIAVASARNPADAEDIVQEALLRG